MANPIKGEVDWVVEGRPYKLVLDFNAICELEDAAGRPTAEVFERVQRGFAADLALLLWASLQRHHDGLSVRDARDIINDSGPEEVGRVITDAVSASSFSDDGGGKKPGKPKRRTGSNS